MIVNPLPYPDELSTGILPPLPQHHLGRIYPAQQIDYAISANDVCLSSFIHPQGMKFDQGKPRWSLLPTGVVAAVVRVLTFGAKKYAPDNWKKIEPVRYEDAAMRHFDAWRSGEKTDPETGESHLAHAVCCLFFLMWFDSGKTAKS